MNRQKFFHMDNDLPAQDNPLNYHARRVNIDKLRKHSSALGAAASMIENAYQGAYAIECLSRLLMADELERDRLEDGQPLDAYLRGGLSAAISHIATGLHTSLCGHIDGLDSLAEKKPGRNQ